jgi:UDP-glucose 4-epimerase
LLYIDQHLTEKLLSSDKKFSIVILDDVSNQENIYSEDSSSRRKLNIERFIKVFKENVRDKETLAKIIKEQNVDGCVHLAANI